MTDANTIPRTIHYCWYGPAGISDLGRRCIETWLELMPDYRLEVWDESRLDLADAYPRMAYRLKKFAFVADYVRLKALYANGGLYLDTDIEVLKRFDPLLSNALFFGLQAPGSVGVGVIGSIKGHPFLKRALDVLDAEARTGRPTFQPLPDLVTSLVLARPEPGPVLFPEDYFYPYNPYSREPLRQKPLQSNISAQTFCIHHWEGTWLGGMSLRAMIAQRLRDSLRNANPARWGRQAATESGG